jgi:hypothetical protein
MISFDKIYQKLLKYRKNSKFMHRIMFDESENRRGRNRFTGAEPEAGHKKQFPLPAGL